MFQVFKRLRCPRNNSHFNTNSPPSSYRAWREISFQHTNYTQFKLLLHTWRKLYQSSKVGDNLELPSHLIAGKSSPFLGWWRFLSPLHAALRPLTAEHHNNSACGMMVSYRFFGCGLTGYCWSRCSCPYCTCLFNDLHYFKVSPIQDEQLKSQPYLNLVSTEAHFYFFLGLAPRSSCESHVNSRHS